MIIRNLHFPHFWLRDHAQDDLSWDHRSHQREFFTAEADIAIAPENPHLDEDGSSLILQWPDQGQAIAYPSDFLYQFAEPDQSASAPYRMWDSSNIDQDSLNLNWAELCLDNQFTEDGLKNLFQQFMIWALLS